MANPGLSLADSPAMRMSQPSARSSPYPAAPPLRAQIVGVSRLCSTIGGALRRSISPGLASTAPRLPRPPFGPAHLGLQVEAGAERPPGAGQHDDAHVTVGVGLQEPGRQRLSIGPEMVFIRSGALSVMVATWSVTS